MDMRRRVKMQKRVWCELSPLLTSEARDVTMICIGQERALRTAVFLTN